MKVIVRSSAGRRFLIIAEYLCAVIGIAALGYCLATYVSARLYQSEAARNFARELQKTQSKPVVPPPVYGAPPPPKTYATAPAPRNGAVVARLVIPRIRVSVMVVEGVSAGDLARAAGHIPGTPLPGQPGNVGIAAHRDTYFRPLRRIERNDLITVRTLQGSYCYRVVSTRVVRPSDVEVLSPTPEDSLTLVTCYPFYYIGAAPKRFIVRAERLQS